MNYQLAKTKEQLLRLQRNAIGLVCVVLVVSTVLQTAGLIYLGYLNHHGKIIERPLGLNSSFWVSDNAVSSSYLAGMARFLTALYLTVSPANVDNQREVFLGLVAPEHFDAIKRELLALDARIKNQSMTSVFYPEQTQIDAAHLSAKIFGELHVQAGNAKLISARKAFELQFVYREGQLFLSQLTEVAT